MTERRDLYPSRVSTEPHFLPRVDPVVYSNWSEEAPLTREQYEAYERDGFLFLEGLLSQSEVQDLLQESARLRSGDAELDPETVFAEMESGDIRSIFRVHAQSPVMKALVADPRLAGLAEFLLGDQVYIHQSRLNYKPGFRGKEFYWHSDFETWHVEDGMPRMRALSMSVLLTDNHEYNGPLMLMPGSHKTFVTTIGETPADHYKKSLRRQEIGVPDDDSLTRLFEESAIVTPKGRAGSVIIFDCNTMHGSASNITPLPRSNAFFVFNALSNRLEAPFGKVDPRPEFVAARADTTPITSLPKQLAAAE
ncbi:MAG TPA: ectoine hydroxylase [Kiloniellales bacterium]|jgi:ectoine hydroxylase|nr:ectoine hydroxylase [Kiloniellales bacterium]